MAKSTSLESGQGTNSEETPTVQNKLKGSDNMDQRSTQRLGYYRNRNC